MNDTTDSTALFATLQFDGADSREYLQGQVSCDLRQLSFDRTLLGLCNSPQGRVQAVFTLIERSDGIVMLLPAAILELTLSRLRKYILRSKVKLHDGRQSRRVHLLSKAQLLTRGLSLILTAQSHVQVGDVSIVRWTDGASERYLVIDSAASPPSNELTPNEWLLADIRAGLPHILPATHEAFTAQMLNVDLLGGISFEKGCYTGQEIIARTHYRGTIKRRMLRFSAACPSPSAATRLMANGEHAGDVLYAANAEGGCELLAVMHLERADAQVTIENEPSVDLQRLSLPYSLS